MSMAMRGTGVVLTASKYTMAQIAQLLSVQRGRDGGSLVPTPGLAYGDDRSQNPNPESGPGDWG